MDGVWMAVGYELDLDVGPITATVLDTPYVVTRLDGDLVAAVDRCPHRGAALSPGEIRTAPDGSECLVCPYHALHFAADGSVRHFPSRPDDRMPARMRLATVPARAADGIIWLCPSGRPTGEIPDWSAATAPGRARFRLTAEVWPVMPSRVVENFNDLAHLATVHAETFGDPDHPLVPPIDIESDGDHIRQRLAIDQVDRMTLTDEAETVRVRYEYNHHFPYSTELVIHFDERRTEWIQMTATPMGPAETLVIQQNVRNFDLAGDLVGWREFQEAVNLEDRLILEGLRPRVQRPDGVDAHEIALAADAFTTHYRRRWARALDG